MDSLSYTTTSFLHSGRNDPRLKKSIVASQNPQAFITMPPHQDNSSVSIEMQSLNRGTANPQDKPTVHPVLFTSTSNIEEETKQKLSEDGVNATIAVQPTTSANETVVAEPTSLAEKSATIPQHVLEFDLMLNASDRANCSRCIILHKGKRFPYEYRDQIEKDSHSFSFTLVMTSTRERIPFIPFFLQRWPSFIALSIQCREHEVTEVVSTLQDLELPDRVTVIIYPVGNANHKFYVNKLRNIAISSIRTTHFLTLDMDMWPTPNLHEELLKLPPSLLLSNHTAIIVPAMFLQPSLVLPHCQTALECAMKSNELFPNTKEELRTCLRNRNCSTMKMKGEQHRYVNNRWIYTEESYLKMKCFANRLQEPYIVLKYSPEMPLFDGRFIDYGCNKVQFVDLLRLMGYEYYIMTQAFAMDIVHHDSSYRKSYLSYARAALSGPMRKLCNRFMAKAALTYPSSYKVDICKTLY